MEIFIPENIRTVISRLEECGYEAYIVGGCVRDALLGHLPHDYDVTTSATPEEMKSALCGYRIIETGIKHGTLTVLAGGESVEVTTFRCDGAYSDHRRPDSVTLTRSLEEDLSRRDLTVNAMAYSEKRGLVDLFGGLDDLRERRVRCVGDAVKRFDEDALRILRALRFAATLDFKIDDETREAVHASYELLSYVSVERIAAELKKLLCGEGKAVSAILFEYSDVISYIIPELSPSIGLDQCNKWHIYDVYTHIAKVVEYCPPKTEVRLAALFHDVAKPKMMFMDEDGVGHFWGHPEESAVMAREIMLRLKLDRETIRRVCRLVEIHDIRPEAKKRALRRYLSKYSDVDFDDIMALRRADLLAQNPIFHPQQLEYLDESERLINEIVASGQCLTVAELEISGHDIVGLGAEGALVGRILDKLLSDVVEEKVENDRSCLLERAKQLYSGMK